MAKNEKEDRKPENRRIPEERIKTRIVRKMGKNEKMGTVVFPPGNGDGGVFEETGNRGRWRKKGRWCFPGKKTGTVEKKGTVVFP
ncbi:MAG: hypothetical protein JXK07_03825 [Spirochaetes bacterium]|nr:hypothetical protein [Spirochaetota bacterium]MBN2770323.1 hypothetical protein [Spirochaetota bacterium]